MSYRGKYFGCPPGFEPGPFDPYSITFFQPALAGKKQKKGFNVLPSHPRHHNFVDPAGVEPITLLLTALAGKTREGLCPKWHG